MTSLEKRSSFSLASIYALRMLGLFVVLPVFALEAAKYPGGHDAGLVGLAMGIYGLTQGLLQIPYGMASDRLGRKRVIVFGLLVFAVGSFTAAAATSLGWLLIGRSIQGAGAVSAAVTALLADQTRDEVRTKAMALVGGSIALMFALARQLPEADASKMDFDKATTGPKAWKEIWGAGQGVGGVHEIVSAGDLVARLKREYRAAQDRLLSSPVRS